MSIRSRIGLVAAMAAAFFANSQGTSAQEWNGLYLGAEVGFDRVEFSGNRMADGIQGRVYAGNDMVVGDNFFLGLEAGGFVGTTQGKPDVTIATVSPEELKYQSPWGLDLGARAGVTVDRFKVFTNLTLVGRKLKDNLLVGSDVANDGRIDGYLEVGAGVEYALTERLVARARFATRTGDLMDTYRVLGGVAFKF